MLVRGAVRRLSRRRASTRSRSRCIEPLGKGSLQQAFEELKEKLEKEGLFDGRAQAARCPCCRAASASSPRPRARSSRTSCACCERRYANLEIAHLPGARAGRRRPRTDIVQGIRALNRASGLRRADRGSRRRQPRGPVAVQRGAGGAGAGRRRSVPTHLRGRARDGLHDRRLRGRPARAHALGGAELRGAGQGRHGGAHRRASRRGSTARVNIRLARVRARGVDALTQHRVFEAERGRTAQPRAARGRAGDAGRRRALARRVERRARPLPAHRRAAGRLPLGPPDRRTGASASAHQRAPAVAAAVRRRVAARRGRARPRWPASSTAARRWPCCRAATRLVFDERRVAWCAIRPRSRVGDRLASACESGRAGGASHRRRRTRERRRDAHASRPPCKKLEEIVQRLEKGELPLEESLVLYEAGHPALAPLPRQAGGGGGQDRAAA